MRVEPYTVDSYVHVLKRGARGMPIVQDEFDRQRFLRLLFYMNDEFFDENWDSDHLLDFERREYWPTRKPLVAIVAYTLMSNHMHLLLKEIRVGGISAFMRKIGQSMTHHHNKKYREKGSIFQGSYKSITAEDDEYLRYASIYIMVKNVFEIYPAGGLRGATGNFDDAWNWAAAYPFSSLRYYVTHEYSPVIDKEILGEIFENSKYFKEYARDCILGGKWLQAEFE